MTGRQPHDLVFGQYGDKLLEPALNADAHFQNNLYAFWINVPPGECASAGIGALEQMLRV